MPIKNFRLPRQNQSFLFPFALFLLSTFSFGANGLSIADRAIHGTVPGYIVQAKAVIEPFGSFAELDLYLIYSDNGQGKDPQLEIHHLFDLPVGASVKDLWLWIGDSIMQAKILKNSDAQAIYDQVTLARRDPALLTLRQGQYELHVYPLAPGGTRKVKLSFILPMEEKLGVFSLPVPLNLLKSSATVKKPLEILFRSRKNAWPVPAMTQSPETHFLKVLDSGGVAYYQALLSDISSFTSLSIEFRPPWEGGHLVNARTARDSLLVQVGVDPDSLFGLNAAERPARKIYVGLDWSGPFFEEKDPMLPRVSDMLQKITLPGDSIRLVASSEDGVEVVSPSKWTSASTEGISDLMAALGSGKIASKKKLQKNPTVIFCDKLASQCWNFTGLDKIANVIVWDHIVPCKEDFFRADIIAAYGNGFENEFTDDQAAAVIKSLDSVFARGGTFLTFIAWNRTNEKIAKHYIQGLQYPAEGFFATNLARVPETEIGQAFPSSIYLQSTYPIIHNDTGVISQIIDSKGRPVVVSKRIGKGRIVVSGIWSFRDGDAQIKIASSPLLGIHMFGTSGNLSATLDSMRIGALSNPASDFLILSNSAGIRKDSDSEPWISGFANSALASTTPVTAINLTTDANYQPYRHGGQGGEYFGRGDILRSLANTTQGAFFEVAKTSWDQILQRLGPQKTTQFDSVSVEAKSGNNNSFISLRPQLTSQLDGYGARFFMEYMPPVDSLSFRVTAKVHGESVSRIKEFTEKSDPIPAQFSDAMVAMFGAEVIRALRTNTPSDTVAILKTSVAYRVLTEFTSFIALEPNDTTHFLTNAPDEGNIGQPTTLQSKAHVQDSLSWISRIDHGGMISFDLRVPGDGNIDVALFDTRGRLAHGWKRNGLRAGSLFLTWSPKGSEMLALKGTRLYCFVRFMPLPGTGKAQIKSGMIAY